jgi:hypothetical protein
MTISVTVAGSAATPGWTTATGAVPAALSLPVPVTITEGDWLIALLAWRQPYSGAGITISVADGSNWWDPLGQPSGTSSPDGITRCAIWAAPAARIPPSGVVMAAPTGYYTALAAIVFDVAGLSPWSQLELIDVADANAATALTLSLAAPAAQSIVLALAGSDNLADTVTLAAGGWSALTTITATNGADHSADIEAAAAWQVTTGATTAAWSSTGALDFSGVLAAIAVTGTGPPTTYPNVYQPVYGSDVAETWPAWAITEIAPGAGPGTPPDELTWVPLTGRALASQFTQGRQYTLDQLQAGQGTMTLDNPDQALIPPGSGAFAGIDSGTPFRTRCAWLGGAWQVQFTGNGTTTTPQCASPNVPASPGQTWSWSAWLACSAPYASGVQVQLIFRNSGGGIISTFTSPNVTGTAPVLATATGTAPAGTTQMNVKLSVNGTPASSVVFYGAAAPPGTAWVQVPPGVAWIAEGGASVTTLAPWQEDPRGAPSITPWYIDSAGYFQRWPPTWDPDLLRGQTIATTTDAWGYANKLLASVLREEILTDQPYAYWPCSDAAGSAAASNIAPGNTNPLTVTISKLGTGGAAQAFGANSGGLPGDTVTTITTTQRLATEGTMWSQAGVGGNTEEGYSLGCTDAAYPPISNGVTVEGWFQWEGGTPTIGVLLALTSATGQVLNVYVDDQNVLPAPPSMVMQAFQNQDTNVSLVDLIATPASIPAGLFHLAIAFNQTTYTAYLNGALIASGTWTYPLPARFSQAWFNGSQSPAGGFYFGAPPYVTGVGAWNGYIAHTAIYPRMLPPGRIQAHYTAGITAMAQTLQTGSPQAGETASYRIERLLQYAGAAGRRAILSDVQIRGNINAGVDDTPVTSCQDIGGQPAATSLTNIAASTVPAILAVRPPGDITYAAKQYVYDQPVMWVLGDDQAAGEIPLQPAWTPDYDPARVVNDIQVTQLDDQSVTVPDQQALEAASQQQYGDQSYQPTGYLQNDPLSPLNAGPGTQDLADWIAATGARPLMRVASVTVDAAKHPSAWPFILGCGAGDPVTINLRPATAGGQLFTVTGRITQTSRTRVFSLDQVEGSVTCVIDTAPDLNALTADDPVRGQLNSENCLAW